MSDLVIAIFLLGLSVGMLLDALLVWLIGRLDSMAKRYAVQSNSPPEVQS